MSARETSPSAPDARKTASSDQHAAPSTGAASPATATATATEQEARPYRTNSPKQARLQSSASLDSDAGSVGAGQRARDEESRHSHKLAERRRRKELKDTFDALEALVLPFHANRGGELPMSKWEILTRASEYMDVLHAHELRLRERLGLETLPPKPAPDGTG